MYEPESRPAPSHVPKSTRWRRATIKASGVTVQ